MTWNAVPKEILSRRVDQIAFSDRVHRRLKQDGIETIEQLVKYTPQELMRYPNFGSKSVREIQDILFSLGLRLLGDSYAGPPSATKATPLYPPEGATLTRIADALERIANSLGRRP